MDGQLLETWAYNELRKLLSLDSSHTELTFYRTHAGAEVGFLLERGGEVAGIEVKSAARVERRDLTGLLECAQMLGKRWRLGVLLHGGREAAALDETTVAIPLAAFFGA